MKKLVIIIISLIPSILVTQKGTVAKQWVN
jgi:hypothetical protein